jgi:hypothetical protein
MGFGMHNWRISGWTTNVSWIKLDGSIIFNQEGFRIITWKTDRNFKK